MQFLNKAQKIMSTTASNYNILKLNLGILFTLSAVVLTFFGLRIKICNVTALGIWILTLAMFYGSLMFASSFIEEEQLFWYWMEGAWLVWLYLSVYAKRSCSTNFSN